jgi:GDP-L-fucose synthase
MKNYSSEMFLNVGTGHDMTILELAESIARVIGWQGTFTLDRSKPDGMPRKVMDVSRLSALGWNAKTDFETGLKSAYRWYVENVVERTA